MPQQPESSLSTWSVPESPLSIDYPASLLRQIHTYVLDGFQRLSRGGMEVGGVLFGSREAGRITLQAWRPMSCEYARGPCFVLSDADKSDLKKLLAACARDPQLRDLEPLGWFASHTRGGLTLLAPDRELYQECFPESWQVTLLLHPQRDAATRAGFFVREPDGGVQDTARREFDIVQEDAEPGRGHRERRETASRVRSAGIDTAEPELPAAGETGRRFPWVRIIVILAVLAAAGAAAAYYLRPSPAPSPFSFDAVDANGQLRIHWDQSAKAVREAVRGVLEVKDGAKTERFDLDAAHVRNGSITYGRQSEDVEMRLTVYEPSGASLTQFSRFLGPPPPANDELQALRQERDRLNAQVAALQSDLQTERDKSARLQRENELRNRLLQLDGVLGRHRAPAAK
ncbi:MAG: hypothetical protein ACRD9L_24105 [Bryobacteraceae bacterium]